MGQVTWRPIDDYSTEWIRFPITATANWLCVDESTPNETDWIKVVAPNKRDFFKFELTTSVPSGATNITMTAHMHWYIGGRSPLGGSMRPVLWYGSTAHPGTERVFASTSSGWYTDSDEFSDSWTVSNINNNTYWYAGIEAYNEVGSNTEYRVDQFYVTVDYDETADSAQSLALCHYGVGEDNEALSLGLTSETSSSASLAICFSGVASIFAAPTDLTTDKQTNPSNAYEKPFFNAVFNEGAFAEDVSTAQVVVARNSDLTDTAWDSGWISLGSTVSDGEICPSIYYDTSATGGDQLSSDPPNDKYWWAIRFKNNSRESEWSSTAYFSGINRYWADPSAAYRKKLLFNQTHDAVSSGQVSSFTIKTGEREVIANNGMFNESIQSSGGFQIAYSQGKTHVVYLSQMGGDDGSLNNTGIFIVTKDHSTGEWGTPYFICSSGAVANYDSHVFPTICIDSSNYIHIFFGCHYSQGKYLRSANPGISGSLPGEDDGSDLWIDPATSTSTPQEISGFFGTYPIPFVVSAAITGSTERIYLAFRARISSLDNRYAFVWSEDNGETWEAPRYFITDLDSNYYRVYCYGFRFDPKNGRLHVAYTINLNDPANDTPIGVWYAYSDYDENELDDGSLYSGFVNWFNIDGAPPDTPDGIVSTSSGSTNPLGRDSAYQVIAPDVCNEYFIERLFLTKSGEPLVFFEHKFHQRLWETKECSIVCAKWNGSSWDIIKISELPNIDTKLRVRRSAVDGLADKDGIIRMFMPVNGKTYHHQLATGTESTSNASTAGATTYHGCVNEGFETTDIDTYLTLDSSSGSFAYFESTTNVSDTIRILGLEVEVVARKDDTSDPDGDFFIGLYNGVTYDTSDAITITDSGFDGDGEYDYYNIYSNKWEINPFTSTEWTSTAAKEVKFGLSGSTTMPIRAYRVVKKVLYTNAASTSYFGSEVHELVSIDEGDTWSIRPLSENSYLGVPCVNVKNDLTNAEIEAIWCSGNDIFYYSSESEYDRMFTNSNDIRLYYNNEEIDRLIDYPNQTQSKITFKLQEDIGEDKLAGTADYYLSFGGHGNSEFPKANPDNVYIFFDNFEYLDVGESIDGVNGWNLIGTDDFGRGYKSPPNHANKVYAGEATLGLAEDGSGYFTLERVIDTASSFTNIAIEFGWWIEGANLNWIELVDSVGTCFKFGIDRSGNYAWYDTSGPSGYFAPHWQYDRFIRCDQQQMNVFSAQVTEAGCSVSINGWNFGAEKECITDVKRIRFRGNSPSTSSPVYLDFVKIYNKSEGTQAGDVIDPPQDDSMIWFPIVETDSSSSYESVDAYCNISSVYSEIRKIDVNLRGKIGAFVGDPTPRWLYYKIHVSDDANYDTANVTNHNIDRSIGRHLDEDSSDGVRVGIWIDSKDTWYSRKFVIDAYRNEDLITGVDEDTSNATSYLYMHNIGTKSIKVDLIGATAGSLSYSYVGDLASVRPYNLEYDPEIEIQSEEYRGFSAKVTIQGAYNNLLKTRTYIGEKEVQSGPSFVFHGEENIDESLSLALRGTDDTDISIALDFTSETNSDTSLSLCFIAEEDLSESLNLCLTSETLSSKCIALCLSGSYSSSSNIALCFIAEEQSNEELALCFTSEISSDENLDFVFCGEETYSKQIALCFTSETNYDSSVAICFTSEEIEYSDITISFVAEEDSLEQVVLSFISETLISEQVFLSFSGAESSNNILPFCFTCESVLSSQFALDFTSETNKDNNIAIVFHGEESHEEILSFCFISETNEDSKITLCFSSQLSSDEQLSICFNGEEDLSETLALSLISETSSSKHIALSFSGAYSNSEQLDIFLHGVGDNSSQISLCFISGESESKSLDLVLHGTDDNSEFLALSLVSEESSSSNIAICFGSQLSSDEQLIFSFGATDDYNETLDLAFTGEISVSESVALVLSGLSAQDYSKQIILSFSSVNDSDEQLAISLTCETTSSEVLDLCFHSEGDNSFQIAICFEGTSYSSSETLAFSFVTGGGKGLETIYLSFSSWGALPVKVKPVAVKCKGKIDRIFMGKIVNKKTKPTIRKPDF